MPKKGIVPGPSRRARSKSANAAVGINPEKQVPTFGDPKLLVTDSNKAASNAPWMVLKQKHSVSFTDCKKLFGVTLGPGCQRQIHYLDKTAYSEGDVLLQIKAALSEVQINFNFQANRVINIEGTLAWEFCGHPPCLPLRPQNRNCPLNPS